MDSDDDKDKEGHDNNDNGDGLAVDVDDLDNNNGLAMEVDGTAGVGYTERSCSDLESNEFCHTKIKEMRDALLDGYKVEANPPLYAINRMLTMSERLTLEHFVAWSKSRGTIKAYTAHAAVLQEATETTILSLYKARKLAAELTGLEPIKVDMCPSSCIAYAGEYKDQTTCTFIRKGKTPCGKARYKSSGKTPKPCAQFIVLSIVPIIKAL